MLLSQVMVDIEFSPGLSSQAHHLKLIIITVPSFPITQANLWSQLMMGLAPT